MAQAIKGRYSLVQTSHVNSDELQMSQMKLTVALFLAPLYTKPHIIDSNGTEKQ